MTTFSDIITNVEKLLRQENGISVQQYSEDLIGKLLQDSFGRIFDKYWMPEFYNAGEDFTLDGTTGKVTADLTTKIKRWRDVRFIWKTPYAQPLVKKPPHLAPTMLIGLQPMWETVADNKIFRIIPVTETGTITVAYRTKPADFATDTVITFDTNIMEAEAAFNFVVDDGANDASAKKFAKMMMDAENEYATSLNSGPRPLAPGRGAPLTVWTSSP